MGQENKKPHTKHTPQPDPVEKLKSSFATSLAELILQKKWFVEKKVLSLASPPHRASYAPASPHFDAPLPRASPPRTAAAAAPHATTLPRASQPRFAPPSLTLPPRLAPPHLAPLSLSELCCGCLPVALFCACLPMTELCCACLPVAELCRGSSPAAPREVAVLDLALFRQGRS